ncbi:MAG: hypothetical protein K2X39_00835 [Silvanigrellaceae bacterium]|nr:hypothetical protein [Silvanigrellaceae bacterium]
MHYSLLNQLINFYCPVGSKNITDIEPLLNFLAQIKTSYQSKDKIDEQHAYVIFNIIIKKLKLKITNDAKISASFIGYSGFKDINTHKLFPERMSVSIKTKNNHIIDTLFYEVMLMLTKNYNLEKLLYYRLIEEWVNNNKRELVPEYIDFSKMAKAVYTGNFGKFAATARGINTKNVNLLIISLQYKLKNKYENKKNEGKNYEYRKDNCDIIYLQQENLEKKDFAKDFFINNFSESKTIKRFFIILEGKHHVHWGLLDCDLNNKTIILYDPVGTTQHVRFFVNYLENFIEDEKSKIFSGFIIIFTRFKSALTLKQEDDKISQEEEKALIQKDSVSCHAFAFLLVEKCLKYNKNTNMLKNKNNVLTLSVREKNALRIRNSDSNQIQFGMILWQDMHFDIIKYSQSRSFINKFFPQESLNSSEIKKSESGWITNPNEPEKKVNAKILIKGIYYVFLIDKLFGKDGNLNQLKLLEDYFNKELLNPQRNPEQNIKKFEDIFPIDKSQTIF